ncbi:MAG: hypothetical protein AAF715_21180 [Myxococcota bacterium]
MSTAEGSGSHTEARTGARLGCTCNATTGLAFLDLTLKAMLPGRPGGKPIGSAQVLPLRAVSSDERYWAIQGLRPRLPPPEHPRDADKCRRLGEPMNGTKKKKKIVATISALTAMHLTACNMPVDDDGDEPFRDAQELSTAESCVQSVRAYGELTQETRGLVLNWGDECLGEPVRAVLASEDGSFAEEADVRVTGELLAGNAGWSLSGGLVSRSGGPSLVAEVLDVEGEVVASLALALLERDESQIRVQGTVNWR